MVNTTPTMIPSSPRSRATPFRRAACIIASLLTAGAGLAQTLPGDGAKREVKTWAAKGLLRSPVAICFDPAGNLYVAESDRAGNAVQDTRNLGKLHAVEDDLQFRSVEDRRAQIKRWIESGAFEKDYFTRTEDRVRVVTDTDGDGVADHSQVFAGGFNDEVDGIGAGVLWLDGTLYYTCIPNLWALRDTNADLKADERTSLAYGYGVRWCFYGHDLHGLTPGPDGRIYFSMGDRGFNVTTKEGKHLVGVDRGGVFRCWPDGSGLELFYQGLRNPQELAFNELGDLFTGDNNCDSGDRARVVYVVEGGDSGWRQDVQSLGSRGPWNREGTWKTLGDVSGPARPAWALPPLAYMGDGPSGLALYPGTGESHSYDGCFFLVDFYGSGSTVHSFRCLPDGAGFKVADHAEYFKGQTITDLAWGLDSRLYMSDWGGGWSPNENGNVITVTNSTVRQDAKEAAAITEVEGLLRGGFGGKQDAELVTLLRHRDQRVRLGAQFELAKRGERVAMSLEALARDSGAPIVARAHAIWALGQISRRSAPVAASLVPLLDDHDAEIRRQAIRTLGDLHLEGSAGVAAKAVEMLGDGSPRVRLEATIALAKVGDATAVEPLLGLLAENENKDVDLRHGASYALSCVGNGAAIAQAARGMNAAARLGAVIALRRMGDAGVAGFMTDADPAVAIEAVRAVYDLRIQKGMAELATMVAGSIPKDRAIEPLMRRSIEANVLIGDRASVERLALCAANPDFDPAWRLLALERMDGWNSPLKREGVWGNWVDLPARPSGDLESAVRGHIDAILGSASGNDKLLTRAYRLQAKHALHLTVDQMEADVLNGAKPPMYRLAVLDQLATSAPDRASRAAKAVLAPAGTTRGALRRRACDLVAKSEPEAAVGLLRNEALNGDLADRQHAVSVLGGIDSDAARAAIADMAADMEMGLVDRGVALEVYEVAMRLKPDSAARKYAEEIGVEGKRPPGYATRLLVAGGDPEAGKDLFQHNTSVECVRCHTIDGVGGNAGPNLSEVASRLSARQLVESVVEPGATVAPGFGTATAMPETTGFLAPRQVRDVVAYLETLRPPAGGKGEHVAIADRHAGTRWAAVAMMILVGAMALRGWTRAE